MRRSAIEPKQRLRGSEILFTISFKRTFVESENWKGMMSLIGQSNFYVHLNLNFDACDTQDTCTFTGNTSEWPSGVPDRLLVSVFGLSFVLL